jgi:hypothetical protein
MLVAAVESAPARHQQPPAASATEASAPAPASKAGEPSRSKRNANYSIDVELDPATHTLIGREVLTWRNVTSRPAEDLRFHLYYNAWMNSRSTWMLELSGRRGRDFDLTSRRPEDWGWVDITGIRLLSASQSPSPFTDLTTLRRFISPDDGNPDDRTVMSVPLPRPVAPGETITVEIAWTSHVPRTFARTGVIGNFFFLAQWFPKIGVLEDTGWNAHQFHAGTEFFSDYGVYDVRITVPNGWIVGATGVEQPRQDTPTGKTTHRFVQEDVHDFAWTTSPDLVERTARFEQQGLPAVEMRLLLQPEHVGQAERHFAATRACLGFYGTWYGPYPYGHVTIVDPAWQSGAGGMEYPTLFTAGTRWLVRSGVNQPEDVTVHECGHQFWYGLVGNNEFEHAWLDEGLNTFSTGRVIAERFQPNYDADRFFGDFIPWVYRDVAQGRIDDGDRLPGYRTSAETDVPSTPSYRYYPSSGGNITYAKTALWLHTLENLIGWPRLQRGMSLFFMRHVFTHPTPQDFFTAVSEGAGTDLTWYFNQVYRSADALDYGIQRFDSTQAATTGYKDVDGRRVYVDSDDRPARYVTELVVRRYKDSVLPVDIVVTFADGHEQTEHWDGTERWHLFRWETPSRATTAAIDPKRRLTLDVNYTNNTWHLNPDGPRAARKWSWRWLIWLQDELLTWVSLV